MGFLYTMKRVPEIQTKIVITGRYFNVNPPLTFCSPPHKGLKEHYDR
jgi:hypothetical protein